MRVHVAELDNFQIIKCDEFTTFDRLRELIFLQLLNNSSKIDRPVCERFIFFRKITNSNDITEECEIGNDGSLKTNKFKNLDIFMRPLKENVEGNNTPTNTS